MTPKRIEANIEHLTGIKGSRVQADVAGFKVEIVGFTFGNSTLIDGNFIGLLLPWMAEKIKESLRDYTPVADAVHDWEVGT